MLVIVWRHVVEELAEFGLELERFGPAAMLVRATPCDAGFGRHHVAL